jgi:hypothetical protein
VTVRVVQAGNDGTAASVDDLRCGTPQRERLGICADDGDAIAADGGR